MRPRSVGYSGRLVGEVMPLCSRPAGSTRQAEGMWELGAAVVMWYHGRGRVSIPLIDSPLLFPITNPGRRLACPQSWKYCAPFRPRLFSVGATCRPIHHDQERVQSEQYNHAPASPGLAWAGHPMSYLPQPLRALVSCLAPVPTQDPVPTPLPNTSTYTRHLYQRCCCRTDARLSTPTLSQQSS